METIPVVIFPHPVLTLEKVRKILPLFGPLTLCLPWQGEAPAWLREEGLQGLIRTLNPPDELDPGEGFARTLNDYREWISYHRDRNDLTFQKTGSKAYAEEDPLWEIRKQIRNRPESPAGDLGRALRRHLILILAGELESSREDAERALNELRTMGSPLTGSVETPDSSGLLSDLPGFKWTPEAMQADPAPVLDAWLGLFGSKIGSDDLLLTMDRQYFDYPVDLWREIAGTPPGVLSFSYPDLSRVPLEELPKLLEIHFTEDMGDRLRAVFEGLSKAPEDTNDLSREARALFDSFPEELSGNRVSLEAVRLGPLEEPVEKACVSPPPEGLLGRTLIFID